MANSSAVSSGDDILASQYNNLRDDVLNSSTGHIHDGTDGRIINISDINGGQNVIHKTANETVNNSATLQNDDDFSFSVDANATYIAVITAPVTLRGASDFKFEWSLPAGGTKYQQALHFEDSGGALGDYDAALGTGTVSLITSHVGGYLFIYAILKIGGTAGTAQFQWAQDTAVAEDTVIEADSFLKWQKVE